MQLAPTNELRFVLRYVPIPGRENVAQGQLILQQKWAVDLTATSVLIADPAQYEEWRDVPLVEESADASR